MLSALPIPEAKAAICSAQTEIDRPHPLEHRLARLTGAIRQREPLLLKKTPLPIEVLLAGIAWANGSGGGFANGAGGGGFVNSGGFMNTRPWGNGSWINGGGFFNYY